MDRDQVIETLANDFYSANCTDKALMLECIKFGINLRGYADMTNEELIQEWEEQYGESITII